jgi:hypothetical protein
MKGHSLKYFWYLFEDKRPEDFKISEARMAKLRKKVEKDKDLAAEIEKIKAEEGDEA